LRAQPDLLAGPVGHWEIAALVAPAASKQRVCIIVWPFANQQPSGMLLVGWRVRPHE
jgi:hypothetical protein